MARELGGLQLQLLLAEREFLQWPRRRLGRHLSQRGHQVGGNLFGRHGVRRIDSQRRNRAGWFRRLPVRADRFVRFRVRRFAGTRSGHGFRSAHRSQGCCVAGCYQPASSGSTQSLKLLASSIGRRLQLLQGNLPRMAKRID